MTRKIFQIVLYLAAGVYGVLGVRNITAKTSDLHPDQAATILLIGFFFLAVAVVAAGVTFLARKWPGLLVLPALILGVPAAIYIVGSVRVYFLGP
jgi:hypothetical protein